MHTIKIGNKTRQLPGDYTELKASQLLRCIGIINNHSISEDLRRELVVYELLKIPTSLFNKLRVFEVLEISQTVNFLFEKPTGVQVIKKFTHKGRTYYTSGNDFENFTLLEFAYADMYFEQFIKTPGGDENLLNDLCATICRELTKEDRNTPEWSGDMRQKFSEPIQQRTAQDFKTLDMSIKLAILKYFVGSRLKLVENYQAIFKGDGNESGGKAGFIPVWFDLIFELSKSNVFGDWDKVAHTGLHKVLIHLTLEKEQQNRLKKQK